VVGTEWIVSGRVRLRRRIVTERRTIDVVVRREVVEFDGEQVDFHDGHLIGTAWDGPSVEQPADPTPFTAVLREEVPIVSLAIRPYERVTVTTTRVQDTATVHDTVQAEHVEITMHPPHDTEEQ
jgi:hypothetical protein